MVAIVPLLPIYGTLKYDGVSKITDWPSIFYWFAGIGLGFLLIAARFLMTRQRVGAEVFFDDGGFKLDLRRFLRGDMSIRLVWSEIEEMKVVEAPRGGDTIAFRLTHDAAVQHGVIEPTTRKNASKKLVRREISFPPKLTAVSTNQAVKRFHASAEQAGAQLVKQASFNVVVFAREIWTVEWP